MTGCPEPEWQGYFYPRSPCGERLTQSAMMFAICLFLSTFPLRGTSSRRLLLSGVPQKFLSTFPLRGTSSKLSITKNRLFGISIHVPLAGNVRRRRVLTHLQAYFYPRSPCGERLSLFALTATQSHFYPRSPCGERPSNHAGLRAFLYFYPRSPCGERRKYYADAYTALAHFYPRSPCGERRQTVTDYCHLFAKVLVTVNIQFWQRG